MTKPGTGWVLGVLGVLAVVAIVAAAVWPRAIVVDLAEVSRGPMSVLVREEGVTRVAESYLVSSPLVGRLRRITLDPGDPVEAGSTVLAVIEPLDPSLLDARARAEAQARVRAAEAAALQAGAHAENALSRYEFAENEVARIRSAAQAGAASAHEVDEAESEHRASHASWRAARFAEEIARFELERARTALEVSVSRPDAAPADEPPETLVIRAPVTGSVLRVERRSDGVVSPGDPLLEIGDPADLEIVADLLSTQAVQVSPGDRVIIEHWGGDASLEGVVRVVEPAAFTKVSALGIEEQRVNVVADFVTPPDRRPSLGDGYRVEVGIVLWADDDVIAVPTSAVFRSVGGWAVYRAVGGRARITPIEIGRQNAEQTEVLGGLSEGDRVVLYPGDRLGDGVRVRSPGG
jgi:HlyD family secretion protein